MTDRFWNKWDDSQRETVVRIIGVVISIITLITILGSVSYLFTWKADQSILSNPESLSPEAVIHNHAGKIGYRLGRFFISDLFGFGSFFLMVMFVALSMRYLLKRWNYSLLKTAFISISGAVVTSLFLSYVGHLLGWNGVFGGGLGGQCGAFLTKWGINLAGPVISGIFVLALVLAWVYMLNPYIMPAAGTLVPGRTGGNDPVGAGVGTEIPEGSAFPEGPAAVVPPEILGGGEEVTPGEEVPGGDVARKPGNGNLPEEPGAEGGTDVEVKIEQVGDDISTKVRKPLPPIDVKDELSDFNSPTLDLLKDHSFGKTVLSNDELTRNRNKIISVLGTYHVKAADVTAVVGPRVTLYKVYLAEGERISSVRNVQEEIAMKLNSNGVRIITLSDSVGIEVANDKSTIVPVKALFNDDAFRKSSAALPVAIGYTIMQKVKVFDLADAPHLLIAGATKQGKSVGLNVIVNSLLFAKHPSELKFVFIDPKMVEFSAYSKLLKHYLAVLPNASDDNDERKKAIVKTPQDANKILRSLCIEMDERYTLMSDAGVNNVIPYNDKYKSRHLLPTEGHRFLPYLVVIIDEFADLTMTVGASAETRAASKSIQNSIIRLAQKGRACGIHVVLATQRPSVDVISGIIKTNFPARIAFRVSAKPDSQTILDQPGAEKLIGKGDMLYLSGVDMERVQCGWIDADEISAVTSFIGDQSGYKKSYNTPYYLPDVTDSESGDNAMVDMSNLDDRFEEAARLVVTTQRGSTSDLQRRMGVGYARAGKLMDQLEAAGIVGPQEGSKMRQILVNDLESLEPIIAAYLKR